MLSSTMLRRLIGISLTFLLLLSPNPVSAQTPTPSPGPVYIVQSGDSLWGLALRFNTTITDLQAVNGLTSQEIYTGQKLIIPGLEGLSGTLTTKPVAFGETLHSLARQSRLDEALMRKLNHIVSPEQLYAGYSLTLLEQQDKPTWTARTSLDRGETLLEAAVKQNTDPWIITQVNDLPAPWEALPGDVLFLPSGSASSEAAGLPPIFNAITSDPLPMAQGTTVQVKVVPAQSVTLRGLLVDHPLHFFPVGDGSQVAFQGIYALKNPGIYPLRIDATLADGSVQSFEQMVPLVAGNFLSETLTVDPETIEPTVTGPEDQWLNSMTAPASPQKAWQGIFQLPVDNQDCIRSRFGTRRSYNGGALYGFHSGVDFGVCSQTHPRDIYAPADGVVVFTGFKTVRGNVTIIDHGWGVYSGLFHQSEIDVTVGDHVTAGQLVGKIGDTGRVTGPHLHWDLWINGVQVDPLLWLNQEFPH
jgi:murein DD-endopeptidase MepM/ murein hydrolase activator NlpD